MGACELYGKGRACEFGHACSDVAKLMRGMIYAIIVFAYFLDFFDAASVWWYRPIIAFEEQIGFLAYFR